MRHISKRAKMVHHVNLKNLWHIIVQYYCEVYRTRTHKNHELFSFRLLPMSFFIYQCFLYKTVLFILVLNYKSNLETGLINLYCFLQGVPNAFYSFVK